MRRDFEAMFNTEVNARGEIDGLKRIPSLDFS